MVKTQALIIKNMRIFSSELYLTSVFKLKMYEIIESTLSTKEKEKWNELLEGLYLICVRKGLNEKEVKENDETD